MTFTESLYRAVYSNVVSYRGYLAVQLDDHRVRVNEDIYELSEWKDIVDIRLAESVKAIEKSINRKRWPDQ